MEKDTQSTRKTVDCEKAVHQREIMRASQHNKQTTKTPISYEGHTNEKQVSYFSHQIGKNVLDVNYRIICRSED